jgi:sugar lactone lactonase YvrE/phosphodiesterase/alkaline phosphatase D-like protein
MAPLALALCIALLAPPTVFAHHGHDGIPPASLDDGRLAGLGNFKKVGHTTYRYLPTRGEYEVRRPGEAPTFLHGDPRPSDAVRDGTQAADEESSAIAGSLFMEEDPESGILLEPAYDPEHELSPICRTSGQRIVVVYTHKPEKYPSAPKEVLRSRIRWINWNIAHFSSQSSSGNRVVKMAVDCNSNNEISIYNVTVPNSDMTTLVGTVPKELFGLPKNGDAVKYLVFDAAGGQDSQNYYGLGQISKDATKNLSNRNATTSLLAVAYKSTWTIRWSTPLHEMFHSLGAVQGRVSPPAPYSTSGHHCTDGIDLMCYGDGTPEGKSYSETRCLEPFGSGINKPIDCGEDTYFDAEPEPSSWLDKYWNLAGPENPFLVAPPKATTTPVASVGSSSAALRGAVNPEGVPEGYNLSYHFEYGATEAYGSSTPKQSMGYGIDPVEVGATIEGLNAGATYHYRLVAESDAGTSVGDDQTFSTPAAEPAPPAPKATTQTATSLIAHEATLNATIDPQGIATAYRFEYGPTTAYGTSLPALDKAAGSGTEAVSASQVAKSLQADTTYHYRIVALRGAERTEGEDMTFKTLKEPKATTEAAGEIKDTSATLNASVNPEGSDTSYFFEYDTSPYSGEAEHGTKVPAAPKAIGAGSSAVSVSESAAGLKPCTTYYYRVVAEGAATVRGQDSTLNMQGPPSALSGLASSVNSAGATLNATVNPCSTETTYRFEYDTTPYKTGEGPHGTSVPIPDKSLGSGNSAQPVSETLSGLLGATVYHFRIVAANKYATIYGIDRTFTTREQVPPSPITGPASEVGSEAAMLNATIDPEGSETEYRFEWASQEEFEATGKYGNASSSQWLAGEEEEKEVPVEQWIEGLQPNGALYHYRIVAINGYGTVYGKDRAFATPTSTTLCEAQKTVCGLWSYPAGATIEATLDEPLVIPFSFSEVECDESTLKAKALGESGEPLALSISAWTFGGCTTSEGPATSCSSTLESGSVLWSGEGDGGLRLDEPQIQCEFFFGFNESCAYQRPLASLEGGSPASLEMTLSAASGELCSEQEIVRATYTLTAPQSLYVTRYPQVLASQATTEPATGIGYSQATVNATIDPEGDETEYRFEYGESASYGSKTAVKSAGSGSSKVAASAALSGLKSDTTYHYRVVAESTSGISRGQDKTFTTTYDPRFELSFGKLGTGNGQLKGPQGMAVDSSGNIWVADTENSRIEKFNSKGEYLFSFGKEGSGTKAEFKSPKGIAIDSEGYLYIADAGNDRVLWYTTEGGYQGAINKGGLGAEGELSSPTGVTVSSGGAIYIVDTGNDRVRKYSASWKLLATIGKAGSGDGELNAPQGVLIDASNRIWVADTGNNRIQRFNPSTFAYVSKFGSEGAGNGQLKAPTAIASDFQERLWVLDSGNNRAQKFDIEGSYLDQIGEKGQGKGQFESPSAVATPAAQKVLVLDTANNRVQSWSVKAEPPIATTSSATSLTAAGATLKGTVNPEGLATTYYFEYGETTAYGSKTSEASAGSGTSGKAYEEAIAGLKANTTYHFRILAKGGGYTVEGKDKSFTTLKAPKATTEVATEVTTASAKLNGTVNPEGSETSYWFEWGEGKAFDHKTAEVSVGSGTTNVAASSVLSGLKAGTSYSFRLVAKGAGASVTGEEKAFTTSSEEGGSSEFSYSSTFGEKGSGNGQLEFPHGVAIDSSGDILVADTVNHRIQKFNSKGEYLSKFGGLGSGNGQLAGPHGIAIDAAGDIWVADTGNHRIEKFNSKGEYLSKFGTEGSGNGQLLSPTALAIDAAGNVLVADSGNDRIEKFNSKGEYLSKFGEEEEENGLGLSSPESIAIDSAGNILVADTGNWQLKKFNAKDEYLSSFGEEGVGPTTALAIDASGDILVTRGDHVEKFNSKGEYLSKFGTEGSGAGQFKWADGIAIDAAGGIWITDGGNHNVQKWVGKAPLPKGKTEAATEVKATSATLNATINPEGSETSYYFEYGKTTAYGTKTKEESAGSGTSDVPKSEAITGLEAGTTYHFRVVAKGAGVTVEGNDMTFTTASDSRYDFSFAKGGTGSGELKGAKGIAVDSSGNIWVADTENNRIEKFSSEGKYLSQFGKEGTGNGEFKSPKGIAIDSSGSIWVADSGNDRVQKFSSEGKYLSQFGKEGTGEAEFKSPTGIAVTGSGPTVYVGDTGNDRVQKLNSSGKWLGTIGAPGSGEGALKAPQGLTVLGTRLYVADTGNDRIKSYSTSSFALILKFGGETTGQLKAPTAIAADFQERLWVIDQGNNCAKKFDKEGYFLNEQIGEQGKGAGQFESPSAVATPAAQKVLVLDTANNRVQSWSVKAEPPVATTSPATNIATTSATLKATINPEALATTYWFEWGTSEAYGSKTEAKSLSAGLSNVVVEEAITGLKSGTKYYFRVVAESTGGTSKGINRTFKTS